MNDPTQRDKARAMDESMECLLLYQELLTDSPIDAVPRLVRAFAAVRAEAVKEWEEERASMTAACHTAELMVAEAVKGLEWSSEKPSKEGFWWYKSQVFEGLVVIWMSKDNVVFFHGRGNFCHVDKLTGEWSGPILPPGKE